MDTLTPKQRAFVREYMVDFCGAEAARRAGYSLRTAKEQAARMLGDPKIKAAIRAATARVASRTDVTVDSVVSELACQAFLDPIHLIGINEPEKIATLPEPVRRALAGWSWDRHGNFVLKFADKGQALERLGRYLGMFIERKETGRPGDFEQLTTDQKLERARAVAKELGLDRLSVLSGPVAGSA